MRVVGFILGISVDNNKVALVFGGVSGKGVSAALYMAKLMSDFRYVSLIETKSAEVMKTVNRILFERSRRGMFDSAIYLLLDFSEKRLIFSNAGHMPILLQKAGTYDVRRIMSSGPPLGNIRGQNFVSEEIEIGQGDKILLYTDGAIEPKNKGGEEFGLTRLEEAWRLNSKSPDALISDLIQDIRGFTGEVLSHDDLTFLALHAL